MKRKNKDKEKRSFLEKFFLGHSAGKMIGLLIVLYIATLVVYCINMKSQFWAMAVCCVVVLGSVVSLLDVVYSTLKIASIEKCNEEEIFLARVSGELCLTKRCLRREVVVALDLSSKKYFDFDILIQGNFKISIIMECYVEMKSNKNWWDFLKVDDVIKSMPSREIDKLSLIQYFIIEPVKRKIEYDNRSLLTNGYISGFSQAKISINCIRDFIQGQINTVENSSFFDFRIKNKIFLKELTDDQILFEK